MEKLTHKGYTGSVEVSLEDDCLHGRVLFINDLITYEGKDVGRVKAAFKAAVDRYLDHCNATGRSPDKTCSGTFNIRLGPVLHRQAAIAAEAASTTLNDFIVRAVVAAVTPGQPEKIVHEHHLVIDGLQPLGQRFATGNPGLLKWETHGQAH